MRRGLNLVDTSMWTCALRKTGHDVERERVRFLLKDGTASWCDAVRLELWRGVGSEDDRTMLRKLAEDLPSLAITSETWDLACRLADAGSKSGLQFPSPDLLIFACAKQHDAQLVTRDKHFEQLASLWPKI